MTDRILIVEDEREIAELLAAYVERAGFEVVKAGTVPDAIRAHAQSNPVLMLTSGCRVATGSTCSPPSAAAPTRRSS